MKTRINIQKGKKYIFGFSLIEVIVSLAILSYLIVLSVGLIPFLLVSLRKAEAFNYASNQAIAILNMVADSKELMSDTETISLPSNLEELKNEYEQSYKSKPEHLNIANHSGRLIQEIHGTTIEFYYYISKATVPNELEPERITNLTNTDDETDRDTLVDIAIDIWWNPDGNHINFNKISTNNNDIKSGHIRYIKRILIEPEKF